MLGTSDRTDMRTVLRKIEAGIIDTTISCDWDRHGGASATHQRRDEPYSGGSRSCPDDARPGPDPRPELAEKLPTVAAVEAAICGLRRPRKRRSPPAERHAAPASSATRRGRGFSCRLPRTIVNIFRRNKEVPMEVTIA